MRRLHFVKWNGYKTSQQSRLYADSTWTHRSPFPFPPHATWRFVKSAVKWSDHSQCVKTVHEPLVWKWCMSGFIQINDLLHNKFYKLVIRVSGLSFQHPFLQSAIKTRGISEISAIRRFISWIHNLCSDSSPTGTSSRIYHPDTSVFIIFLLTQCITGFGVPGFNTRVKLA